LRISAPLPFLETNRRRWVGTGGGFFGEGGKNRTARPAAADSISGNVSAAWSSLRQQVAKGLGVDGQIRGTTAGNQVSVDDHRLIHPAGAGVLHVVPDAGGGSDPLSLQDPGRDQHPTRVADLSDGFSRLMEGADGPEHPRVAAQFVRRPSAGDQEAVILFGI